MNQTPPNDASKTSDGVPSDDNGLADAATGKVDDGATSTEARTEPVDEGPGWMPAIMAATVLVGIIGFVFCGFSTWVLFQRRTEMAVMTLRGDYLPRLDQSRLDPDTKRSVVEQIGALADDMERGKYENWQSSGILQRLQRLPVIQWGRLQAVAEVYRADAADDPKSVAVVDRDLSRLLYAIDEGRVTSFDFIDILKPVQTEDPSDPSGVRLIEPIELKQAELVFDRVALLLEDLKIPEQRYDDVRLNDIVGDAIQAGANEGSM